VCRLFHNLKCIGLYGNYEEVVDDDDEEEEKGRKGRMGRRRMSREGGRTHSDC
jgi:hypothetical protein